MPYMLNSVYDHCKTKKLMPNRLAPYKDPDILQFVREWFQTTHHNDYYQPGIVLTLDDLYDEYYQHCTPQVYNRYRLNQPQFEKVAHTAGIWDLGGRFIQVQP